MLSGYHGLYLSMLAVGPHGSAMTSLSISMLGPARQEQLWFEHSTTSTTDPTGKSVVCGVSAHDNLASHSTSVQEEVAKKSLQAGKHHLSQYSSSCSSSTSAWCLVNVLPWAQRGLSSTRGGAHTHPPTCKKEELTHTMQHLPNPLTSLFKVAPWHFFCASCSY